MRLKASASRLPIVLAALFSAAPGVSADIVQVDREALVNGAQYAAARATAEAGREKLPQGLSGLLPTIGATASTTWNEYKYNPDSSPNASRNYNSNAYNVNLTRRHDQHTCHSQITAQRRKAY